MSVELTLFQPHPGTLYSLEVTCDLTGATRRSILVYCRQRLVKPVFLPPFGVMAFDAQALRRIRQIERLRAEFDLNPAAVKMIAGLLAELHRLQTELACWHRL
jgi:DNA-binding transcriptional MerR regulator